MIIALIGLTAAFVGFIYLSRTLKTFSLAEGIAVFLSIVTGVILVIFSIMGCLYIGASYKADIINREYQTDYTTAEIFYAGEVIETIRQIQRTRIEINGDVMRDAE